MVMMHSGFPIAGLSAARDVEQDEKSYSALSDEPWLRLDFHSAVPHGRWIELRYATSFFDPLARPVLRSFSKDAYHDEILPGALFGRAIWIGYIPKETREIWISPINRVGPFSFAIEHFAALSPAQMLWRALRQNASHCLLGIGAELIGLRHFAKVEFKKALSAESFATYNEWRERRSRRLDLNHFDVPRTDWTRGPHVRFLGFPDGANATDVTRLLSELDTQSYPNWSSGIVTPSKDFAFTQQDAGLSAKLAMISPDRIGTDLLHGLSDDDFIAPVAISDSIPAYSLPVFAETASRDSKTDIFYGDEEFVGEDGRHFAPQLRPDWSTAVGMGLTGTARFFRVRFLKEHMPSAIEWLRPAEALSSETRLKAEVSHIRRVMRSRRGAPPVYVNPLHTEKCARVSVGSVGCPRATLIIPTKDRFDLLSTCVESLRTKTCLDGIEIIVVDNGTEQSEARRLLDRLAHEPHFRVISRPGAFDFASFCNDAASEALAPVLVFLNNDTEIIDETWLDPLLHWAQQPGVGAVGAKLLYPNGRVQHAGVVLGMGGRAGHFERTLPKDDPGYLGRLRVPHEVSSVTAACLAVEKRKFDAVNGFDAVNLPVELNDIDLCLRLAEHGWATVFVPESVLIHRESASRGIVLHPDKTYGREHMYFRTRWIHRLRDDRFFHPALSLHAIYPALE
jgi:O-antigen biosynthesis protein